MADKKTVPYGRRKVKGKYEYYVGTREFKNKATAKAYYDQEMEKLNKSKNLSFPNPVTGKTETVLDSSAMETRLGHIEKKQKSDIGSKNKATLVDITELEHLLTSRPESETPAIQAQIEQKYQELEAGFKVLGIDYQRVSGDADEGGGGFWKGVGDFLTPDPNPERDFKVKMTRDLNKQLAIGEIKIPPTWKRNQNKWIEKKVDDAWKSKQAEIPLEHQSIDELIKGAGTE